MLDSSLGGLGKGDNDGGRRESRAARCSMAVLGILSLRERNMILRDEFQDNSVGLTVWRLVWVTSYCCGSPASRWRGCAGSGGGQAYLSSVPTTNYHSLHNTHNTHKLNKRIIVVFMSASTIFKHYNTESIYV